MKKRIAVILSFWMPPLLQAHYYFHAESCSLGMTADSQNCYSIFLGSLSCRSSAFLP